MKRFSSIESTRLLRILIALVCFAPLPAAFANGGASHDGAAENKHFNPGAQIECTLPDGRVLKISSANEQPPTAALVMDDNTFSCPLPEGQTTFVIRLPAAAVLDRFTFINENALAAGQLKISVSDDHLRADSPKWADVEGSISFTKKRVFNVSMVGVEARYVKLSFNVEKAGRIASLGLYGGDSLERFEWRQEQAGQQVAWISSIGSTGQH